MRIKLGHYLMRSRITFPGTLASSLVEAAILALDSSTFLQPNNTNSVANQTVVSTPSSMEVNMLLDAKKVLTDESMNTTNSVTNIPRCSSSATSVIQQRRLAEHGLDLLAHFINK